MDYSPTSNCIVTMPAALNGEEQNPVVGAKDSAKETETTKKFKELLKLMQTDGGNNHSPEEVSQTKQDRVDDQIRKMLIPITGPTAAGFAAYSLTISSTPDSGDRDFKTLLALAASANAVGFVACLASLYVSQRRPVAAKVLDRVGSVAAVTGVMLTLAMVLPMELIWLPLLGVTFFIAVALLF